MAAEGSKEDVLTRYVANRCVAVLPADIRQTTPRILIRTSRIRFAGNKTSISQ
jgi:hypothetical protein